MDANSHIARAETQLQETFGYGNNLTTEDILNYTLGSIADSLIALAKIQSNQAARVWEDWEEVPQGTPVFIREHDDPFRKLGDKVQIKEVTGWRDIQFTPDLRSFAPFLEAR